MANKFSEVEWDDGTIFNVLQEHGFFPYSGEDGDLFRKHGLAGWRVSVYGRELVRIQKNTGQWKGHYRWTTVEEWGEIRGDELEEDAIREFEEKLEELVEEGEL